MRRTANTIAAAPTTPSPSAAHPSWVPSPAVAPVAARAGSGAGPGPLGEAKLIALTGGRVLKELNPAQTKAAPAVVGVPAGSVIPAVAPAVDKVWAAENPPLLVHVNPWTVPEFCVLVAMPETPPSEVEARATRGPLMLGKRFATELALALHSNECAKQQLPVEPSCSGGLWRIHRPHVDTVD